MNLPRGTLKSTEKWEHARPIDYLSKADLNFSGVIRFFERGPAWNVFFLLFEESSVTGYYTTRGDSSLEEKLHTEMEGFEVEVRTFTPSEMEIARTLNTEYLLDTPLRVSKMLQRESDKDSKMKDLFPDLSILSEIKKAKQFREDFNRRRIKEVSVD